MEEKRLAAKILTDNEESLYNNSAGAIVKTILLHNSNSEQKEVTLKLDGVAFLSVSYTHLDVYKRQVLV